MSKYEYYWKKKNRQQGYKKIANTDQIVFWMAMTPVLAFYLLFYIADIAIKIGAW